MILNYVCHHDSVVFQTGTGVRKDSALLGVWLSCPLCRDNISLCDIPPSTYRLWRMTPEELYKASQGNGLPLEKDLSIENITRLFTTGTVKGITLEEPTSQRVLVADVLIEYEGKILKVHFGTSSRGAAIFKITETT